MALGTVMSFPFTGVLAATLGWEWVFYVQGGLALIWCILWVFLVYDSPHQHPRIHPDELKLFEFMTKGREYAVNSLNKHKFSSPSVLMSF